MSTLFISHSSQDNQAALELKARLEEKGHGSVFLDLDPDKGIQAGVSWERTLYTPTLQKLEGFRGKASRVKL